MKTKSSPWHFVCSRLIPFSGNWRICLLFLCATVTVSNCHLVFRLLLSAHIWTLKGLYFSVQSLKWYDLPLFGKVEDKTFHNQIIDFASPVKVPHYFMSNVNCSVLCVVILLSYLAPEKESLTLALGPETTLSCE